MKTVLINNIEYFEKNTIEKLKKKFKFSQSIHIEMLLWDFEIFAQLTAINPDFVLKGGAATQIYLPVEKQRASRDIDLATTLSKTEIEKVLEDVKRKFEKRVKNNEHFTWKSVQLPVNPERNIEDLHCYDIVVPTKLGLSRGLTDASNLRIDSITYKKLPFIIKKITSPLIFNLKFKPFLAVSEGSLIADKLLTLADTTVGILAIRKEDYESYLKQVYDLIHLTKKYIEDVKVLKDVIFTIKELTPIELEYRKLLKSTKDVLLDILVSLEKREFFDFDSSEIGKNLRQNISNFQGNYLNKSEWGTTQMWGARIGKLRFIVELLKENLEKKYSIEQISDILRNISKIEDKLDSLKGKELKESQIKLMNYFKGDNKINKQLKNAKPTRILFGVLTKANAKEIIQLIGG